MGFEALLGNEQLRQNLRSSIGRGRISHFYLISGPTGSGKHTLARLLSAAILCASEEKPCNSCPACRKVLSDLHPDYITVDDPEKKTVSVDLIRQARSDIYVHPNEGSHKIYLLPRAQDLGISGQNALLKVLEEPPKYGVFILLTDNPEKLLPTVRSRCTQLKLLPLPEKLLRRELTAAFPKAEEASVSAAISRSGGFLGQAKALLQQDGALPPQTESFVQSYCQKDAVGLTATLVPMEKWKRDQLITVLEQWLELLEGGLACRAGAAAVSPLSRQLSAARSAAELMHGISCLQKTIEYAQGNVSPAAVCGYLSWALR